MKAQLKKIGSVILDILVIMILVISLTVVVLSVTARKNGVSNIGGYTILSVKTDSMEPTIMVGDLIIGRVSESDAEYEIGDVVTFREIIDSTWILNTHRIVEKTEVDGTYRYETKGDNAPDKDEGQLVSGDIVSRWDGIRIPYLGGALTFLRSGVGFFVFLMIPVILFFLFYLYNFVKNLILYNRENAMEAAKEAAKEAAVELDEEQKKRIIAEYLAAQAGDNGQPGNQPAAKDKESEEKDSRQD